MHLRGKPCDDPSVVNDEVRSCHLVILATPRFLAYSSNFDFLAVLLPTRMVRIGPSRRAQACSKDEKSGSHPLLHLTTVTT